MLRSSPVAGSGSFPESESEESECKGVPGSRRTVTVEQHHSHFGHRGLPLVSNPSTIQTLCSHSCTPPPLQPASGPCSSRALVYSRPPLLVPGHHGPDALRLPSRPWLTQPQPQQHPLPPPLPHPHIPFRPGQDASTLPHHPALSPSRHTQHTQPSSTIFRNHLRPSSSSHQQPDRMSTLPAPIRPLRPPLFHSNHISSVYRRPPRPPSLSSSTPP